MNLNEWQQRTRQNAIIWITWDDLLHSIPYVLMIIKCTHINLNVWHEQDLNQKNWWISIQQNSWCTRLWDSSKTKRIPGMSVYRRIERNHFEYSNKFFFTIAWSHLGKECLTQSRVTLWRSNRLKNLEKLRLWACDAHSFGTRASNSYDASNDANDNNQ